MNSEVYVVGLGMSKFTKPNDDDDYVTFSVEAIKSCLNDCGLNYNLIDHAICGYVYGDSCCGQTVIYEIGMTGIPIINVNNNCASGSSALYLGYNLIKTGISKCCMVVGFEKMKKGALESVFRDRTNPLQKHAETMMENWGFEASPVLAQMFGNAAREHMKKYGTTMEHFAKVASKNHKHSLNNPKSQYQKGYSVEEVKESPMVFYPLTRYQCCPPSNGAAAVILVGEEFLSRFKLQNKSVKILDMVLQTDSSKTFESASAMELVGYSVTKNAAKELYKRTKLRPVDFGVIELHDCFSVNELITYEALQLCKEGEASKFIDAGHNTYGANSRHVINPSGGLLSKGHPLGATGVAQCVELCLQLRGEAGPRQVPSTLIKPLKYGLQHNLGLGGAIVIAAYTKGTNQIQAKL